MGDCPRRVAMEGASREEADDREEVFDPSHGEKGPLTAVRGVEGVCMNP